MAKFTYDNAKNVSIRNIFFELNHSYYFWILYRKDIDFCFNKNLVRVSSKKYNKKNCSLFILVIISLSIKKVNKW